MGLVLTHIVNEGARLISGSRNLDVIVKDIYISLERGKAVHLVIKTDYTSTNYVLDRNRTFMHIEELDENFYSFPVKVSIARHQPSLPKTKLFYSASEDIEILRSLYSQNNDFIKTLIKKPQNKENIYKE